MKATTQIKMRGVYNMRPLLPRFTLSNNTVVEIADINFVIGTFSGASDYTLTDPSGQFAIDGNLLRVAAELTAGEYVISVDSSKGRMNFTITVTA